MASVPIYRFYAQLADYKPAIWRRFEVPKNISMARLAYIMMTLFEMQASHLFSFDVPARENFLLAMGEDVLEYPAIRKVADELKERHLALPSEDDEDDEDDEEKEDAAAVQLGHILNTPLQRLVFWYDFGDDWKVLLSLEKIYEDRDLPGRELPRVLDGAGYGIIEDCGGPGGLAELARATAKKKGPKYEELREWYELDDIDLKNFDLDDMNFRLKKVPRIYRDIYEEDLEPTQRSMDILTRQYLKKKGWHPA